MGPGSPPCAGQCEPGEGPAGTRWTASWCGGDAGRTSSGAGGEGHPGGVQRAKVLDPRGTSPAPGVCDDVGQQGWTRGSKGVAPGLGPGGGKQRGRWGLVGPLAGAVGEGLGEVGRGLGLSRGAQGRGQAWPTLGPGVLLGGRRGVPRTVPGSRLLSGRTGCSGPKHWDGGAQRALRGRVCD